MPTDSFWDLPIATLEKALHLRRQIEALQKTEQDIMGGVSSVNAVAKRRGRPSKTAPVTPVTVKKDGRTGKRSAATIAKMKAAAQRARWAKVKG